MFGRRTLYTPKCLRPAQRIWLVIEHDLSQQVGRVVDTWADDTGQWVEVEFRGTAAGVRAYARAKDGSRCGLSVGSAGLAPVLDDDGGVRRLTSVPWLELSLTRKPMFEQARLLEVR